jgi:hypothetical protein
MMRNVFMRDDKSSLCCFGGSTHAETGGKVSRDGKDKKFQSRSSDETMRLIYDEESLARLAHQVLSGCDARKHCQPDDSRLVCTLERGGKILFSRQPSRRRCRKVCMIYFARHLLFDLFSSLALRFFSIPADNITSGLVLGELHKFRPANRRIIEIYGVERIYGSIHLSTKLISSSSNSQIGSMKGALPTSNARTFSSSLDQPASSRFAIKIIKSASHAIQSN